MERDGGRGWNRLWTVNDYRPRREIDDYGAGDAAERIVATIARCSRWRARRRAARDDRSPPMKDTHDRPRPPLPSHDVTSARRSSTALNGEARPLRILLACNYDPANAATVCDHINAFARYSRHEIRVLSRVGEIFDGVKLETFDAVVIHYSLFLAIEAFVGPRSRRALAAFRGAKAVFIQDEYRFVNATLEALEACGVDLVFTCLGPAEAEQIYGKASKAAHPAGADRLRAPMADALPARSAGGPQDHGRLSRPDLSGLAWRAGPREDPDRQAVQARRQAVRHLDRHRLVGTQPALRPRLGEVHSRLPGRAGRRERGQRLRLRRRGGRPHRKLRRPGRAPPPDPRPGPKALVRDAARPVLRRAEDQIDIAQISPRVFEAIALRTLIIAYPGRYSGVLEPWRHYVPLDKDHGNMAEVAAVLRDPERVAEIITNAYAEIALNPAYGYGAMIEVFDERIAEAAAGRPRAAVARPRRRQVPQGLPVQGDRQSPRAAAPHPGLATGARGRPPPGPGRPGAAPARPS
jgi:hypothetical protein